VGVCATRPRYKEIKKRKYIKEKKVKKMNNKIKEKFFKSIGAIYTELYETFGKSNADNIIQMWLKEMSLLFLKNK
jgi:hypothetical protein